MGLLHVSQIDCLDALVATMVEDRLPTPLSPAKSRHVVL